MTQAPYDDYKINVIDKGAQGSDLLKQILGTTLKYQTRRGGTPSHPIHVVDFDESDDVETIIASADPGINPYTHPQEFGASLVYNLHEKAQQLGGELRAMANVVDTSNGDTDHLRAVATGTKDVLDLLEISNLNGENAIIGDVVTVTNLMGVGIMAVPKSTGTPTDSVGRFKHNGRAVVANSDGTGSRLYWDTLRGTPHTGLVNVAAMNADDMAKYRARAEVLMILAEKGGPISLAEKTAFASVRGYLEHSLDSQVRIVFENSQGRLRSVDRMHDVWNMNGVAVGTISEEELAHPPYIHEGLEGSNIIVISGASRSNGHSALIPAYLRHKEQFSADEKRELVRHFARPSTLLYSVFMDLFDQGLAQYCTHSSGGGAIDRVGKPLIESGLSVDLDNLFEPHDAMKKLMELEGWDAQYCFGKFAMSNEGYVITDRLDETINHLERKNISARDGGKITKKATPTFTINSSVGVATYIA